MVSSKSTIEMKQDQSIDDTYDAEEEYLNEVAGAPASPKRKDKAGYKRMNSVPTAKELQAASTPGRQRKNDGTGEMARRVVAKWGEQVGDEDDDDFHVDLAEKSPRRLVLVAKGGEGYVCMWVEYAGGWVGVGGEAIASDECTCVKSVEV